MREVTVQQEQGAGVKTPGGERAPKQCATIWELRRVSHAWWLNGAKAGVFTNFSIKPEIGKWFGVSIASKLFCDDVFT